MDLRNSIVRIMAGKNDTDGYFGVAEPPIRLRWWLNVSVEMLSQSILFILIPNGIFHTLMFEGGAVRSAFPTIEPHTIHILKAEEFLLRLSSIVLKVKK